MGQDASRELLILRITVLHTWATAANLLSLVIYHFGSFPMSLTRLGDLIDCDKVPFPYLTEIGRQSSVVRDAGMHGL